MSRIAVFLRNDSGATAIEYALIAAGVAAAIIGAVNITGISVLNMWAKVAAAL
jgi:pilus assembly protein Flp/PilA